MPDYIIPKADDKKKLADNTKPYPTAKMFYNLLGIGIGQAGLDQMPLLNPKQYDMLPHTKKLQKYSLLKYDVVVSATIHTYITDDIENMKQQSILGMLCDHDIELAKSFLESSPMQKLARIPKDKHDNEARKYCYDWLRSDPIGMHVISKNITVNGTSLENKYMLHFDFGIILSENIYK